MFRKAASGRLIPTGDGSEAIVGRTFRAPIGDVSARSTEPDRTAPSLETWKGDMPGRMIKMQMGIEDRAM